MPEHKNTTNMKAKIFVNSITLLRFPLAITTALAIWQGEFAIAAGAFCVGLISDFIDGPLARRLNAETELGAKILEPLADTALLLGASIGLVLIQIIPWPIIIVLVVLDQIINRLVKPHFPRPDRILFVQAVLLESANAGILLYLLFFIQPILVYITMASIPIIIYAKRKRIKHFAKWCFRNDSSAR
ncbi:CDP-alcohol phosphatidyltransferase family protein [Patescibacteria group bacterium]|nr:CDP-alcohol phosphatidyltransferase family protein [Patescibacteria group bacterium]MBU1922124.1 CDP-alcohol phosphatidyltransferase family protein [Patescibacteria group bacterium]